MREFTKCFLTSLAILITSSTLAQPKQISGADYIESLLASRIEKEGGKASDLWKRPWRIIFLFNSVQTANKSGYTNAALATTKSFLSRRLKDGQPHRVWFYPYQLGVYTGAAQSVVEMPLNPAAIQKVEQVFPRVPYEKMPDGVTPFSGRGGHDNLDARVKVSETIAKSKTDTLLVQITDIEISEKPGSPDDLQVRSEDRSPRGVEPLGLTYYEGAEGPLETNSPRQKMYLLVYGPQKLHVVVPQPIPFWLWLIPVAALGLAGLAFLLYKTGGIPVLGSAPKWSVTLPEVSSFTLSKGESQTVVGKGASEAASGSTSVTVFRADDVPAAKLFEVHWDKRGVLIKSGLWEASTAASDGSPIIDSDSRVTFKDKTGKGTRIYTIKVSQIEL